MDTRTTLNSNESFLKKLYDSMREKLKVNMLIDKDGISRVSGYVRTIDANSDPVVIELESGEKLQLKHIIAVDGVFLPDYGEC